MKFVKFNDLPLHEAGPDYAGQGWPVFRLQDRGKKPRAGSSGCKGATVDYDEAARWWDNTMGANIGIATGAELGLFVLDVDGERGESSLAKLMNEIGPLPETLSQRTGGGGRHLFFKVPEGVKIGCRVNMRPGLDVRGDGGYVVAPPSKHPDGGRYEWLNDMEAAEAPAALLAEITGQGAEQPKKPAAPPWEMKEAQPETKPRQSVQNDRESTMTIERASLYLRECDPALQGAGGHNALLWAARAMVVGFELSDSDALSLLWSEYNPRCLPPWDEGKPADRRDFERKIQEARKTPGTKPRGWLLDECGLRACDSGAVEIGRQSSENLLASADSPKQKKAEKEETPEKCPEWLLKPPGLVGDMCAWINETAGCHQPFLTLGASLCACGALFGRKVRDDSNGRTNIFAMGVAHSSAGKDHPPDCIQRLFHAARAGKLLGGAGVTGDTAIATALEHHPAKLFLWDEVGHMMNGIKAGSGSNPHLSSIVPTLMTLYSSPHKHYIGKQKAGEAPYTIDQPHVCIWGYTSPDVLYKGMTEEELKDGWLGRNLTFISHDRPMYRMKPANQPPADLVEQVSFWFEREVEPPEGSGNIESVISKRQLLYNNSGEAASLFEAFGEEAHDRMLERARHDDPTEHLWGKALQNARRIALIVAASEQPGGGAIEEHHARYGCDLVRYLVETFAENIRGNAFSSPHEQDCNKALRKLRESGGVLSHSALLKKMRLDARSFKEVVSTLLQREDIETHESSTTGRTALSYRLKGAE